MFITPSLDTWQMPQDLDVVTVDHTDAIPTPLLRQLHAYWDSKRRGRAFPARADIDPLELRTLLRHIILLDIRRDPLDLVYRLAGTEVVDRLGTEPTGRRLLGLPVDDSGAVFAAFAETAVDGRPRLLNGALRTRQEIYKNVERLVLPLSGNGIVPDKLLGAMLFHPCTLDERIGLPVPDLRPGAPA